MWVFSFRGRGDQKKWDAMIALGSFSTINGASVRARVVIALVRVQGRLHFHVGIDAHARGLDTMDDYVFCR